MAKVNGPLHSTEARGAVGGLVYNTWRGISTVKSRSGPSNQYTARRSAVRAAAAQATAAWKSLSPGVRQQWKEYADQHPELDWTGNPRRITGFNWFTRCNVRLIDMRRPMITSPPAHIAPVAPLNFGAETAGPTITVYWGFDLPAPGTTPMMDIWGCGPHSPAFHPSIKDCKHLAYVLWNTSPNTLGPRSYGYWTLFARFISTAGLASPWTKYTFGHGVP